MVSRTTEMPDRHEDGIGRCIFCLDVAKPLTREHIIPYALSSAGEMFFREGSCDQCNGVMNKRFENPALQNDLLDVRAVLDLKRRKRGNQKSHRTHPVRVLGRDFRMHWVKLKAAEHPGHVAWKELDPPSMLTGKPADSDGALTNIRTFAEDIMPERAAKFPVIEYRIPHISGAVPLLMAKAAYAFAVAELGLEAFDGEGIRELLRGDRSDIYNFVGGVLVDEEFDTDSALHKFYTRRRGNLQTVIVHLFASFNAPPWEIVVGEARDSQR